MPSPAKNRKGKNPIGSNQEEILPTSQRDNLKGEPGRRQTGFPSIRLLIAIAMTFIVTFNLKLSGGGPLCQLGSEIKTYDRPGYDSSIRNQITNSAKNHVRTSASNSTNDVVLAVPVVDPAHVDDHVHLTFSQVFGEALSRKSVENNVPPPENTWLLNPASASDATRIDIPKIINKIFFQKKGGFQEPLNSQPQLQAAHKSWSEKNPGYDVRYFDLDRSRKYLKQHFHPMFLRAFDCIEAFAGKSNLVRMALLYREGGWHSDWKQVCMKDHLLDQLSNRTKGLGFFAVHDLGNPWSIKQKCVQNAFVGATPQHPFIARQLKLILMHVQSRYHGDHPLDTTGVCVLNEAIRQVEQEAPLQHLISAKPSFAKIAGRYEREAFRIEGEAIVIHKCARCGWTQKWGDNGNSYVTLHAHKNYYCEDAASLFSTTS